MKKGNNENLLNVTYKVVKEGLVGKADPNYEYKFPERKMLHEKTPSHVQAVNQHLDKEGIDLEKKHVEHFERGTQIDDFKPKNILERGRKEFKTLKNETKIAQSFHEEAEAELQKGANADQRKIVYAKAGWLAHTMLGGAKAARNPYFAHEEGFEIGTTADYLLSSKQNSKK
ncbi:hypothetical protein DGG96_13285 [Legionella qingyii]|uniref:Uncharacterized protein n=1 Tax=Legionella qingyii TaxID=2184757 RepID=A0A317U1A3_9GAMM|nr:hypothetical protein [Legionella qingyii]PWY55149.1 hypothetical protein DGG96_13285 [Legionella qingyii]RUR25428.1 hypothetical protein ELY20_02940 [Legionella qingyii]RUR28461.1 hypothetical protein ELY16_03070 [Legionella qingyii]